VSAIPWIGFYEQASRRATMELLPDLLVYARMHESNLSVEPGTRRMTPHMQDAILPVVKASLDRRRRNRDHNPSLLNFSTTAA